MFRKKETAPSITMEFTNLEEEQPQEQPSETPKPNQNFQNYASTEDTSRPTKEKTRPTPKQTAKVKICCFFVYIYLFYM